MALDLKRRRFTVEEYHRMAASGILSEDDRVELIEGEIIEMTPIGRRHASCVARLTQHFAALALKGAAVIWVQNPIRLGKQSEPQPDFVLLRPQPDLYASIDPTSADVLLLVEVSDTSVDYDRRVKLPLYARAGIPEVWMVDLGQSTITSHRDAARGGYRIVQPFRRGEQLTPASFPDLTIAVDDLLPA